MLLPGSSPDMKITCFWTISRKLFFYLSIQKMLTRHIFLVLFFSCILTALEKVFEAKVVETFVNSLQDLKPTINGLELLKYTCQDWRKLCCTKNRGILKRQTLGIICDNIQHIYLKSINFWNKMLELENIVLHGE